MAPPGRRARRRWPTAGSSCGCRRARRSSSSSTSLASTEIRERLAPGRLGDVVVEPVSDAVTRIVMPAGGGVAGQPVNAYLVGRRRFVLVDPGDPTGPALDRAIALAAERGGTIEAIALTHVDPDHAAGVGGSRRAARDPRRRRPRSRSLAAIRGPRSSRPRDAHRDRRPADRRPDPGTAARSPRLHRRRGRVGHHGRPRRDPRRTHDRRARRCGCPDGLPRTTRPAGARRRSAARSPAGLTRRLAAATLR